MKAIKIIVMKILLKNTRTPFHTVSSIPVQEFEDTM